MSFHICNSAHPNCSNKGCFIDMHYIIELTGCLFGNIHELIVSHIIENTYNGSFLHSLVKSTNLSIQNITFALDDLKTHGIVLQHGTTVFDSLWTIVEKIDITWLCNNDDPAVLGMYNAFRNRIVVVYLFILENHFCHEIKRFCYFPLQCIMRIEFEHIY